MEPRPLLLAKKAGKVEVQVTIIAIFISTMLLEKGGLALIEKRKREEVRSKREEVGSKSRG